MVTISAISAFLKETHAGITCTNRIMRRAAQCSTDQRQVAEDKLAEVFDQDANLQEFLKYHTITARH